MCEFATFHKDENQWEPCWECDQCKGVEPDFDSIETPVLDKCLDMGKALKKLINRNPGQLEDDLPF